MKETFRLTLNPQDLRDIHSSSLKFNLFKRENILELTVALILFCLSFFLILISDKIDRKLIYVLLLLSSCFYFINRLINRYWKTKTSKESFDSWIQSLLIYETHHIEFHKMSMNYIRDGVVFEYDLNAIKDTKRSNEFFFLELTNDEWIILPKKSFSEGDFERFLESFDSRVSENKSK